MQNVLMAGTSLVHFQMAVCCVKVTLAGQVPSASSSNSMVFMHIRCFALHLGPATILFERGSLSNSDNFDL